ncbi:type II DNA topoisomerase [Daedalea quercina L-15889]|uniref:DNA topoisomerase 2 n=1 Tax=Daedalea quercina L-15889 TaxID=1314783 RepID=A0A165PYV4_9APHY|nr:type II DNA topoisomerase [Daedalea quercina L-15889]
MSSSEENFDLDNVSGSGSESDDYAPAPKKATKATAKATAKTKAVSKPAKAPAKSKASAAKKKVLADKDDNAHSDVDMIDDDDAGPSVRAEAPAAPAKKKTASETYTKLSQLEHILKRPDSYIGSVETITQPMWVWDSDSKRMVHREIKYVPGFFKIVDEILVNAADNKINDPTMDTIKVTIDPEKNSISVFNNGRGIPIEMHSKERIYIPELIFGHLLSSSNYDDDEKKLTGGRNGYGAKLANIYSTEFTVDTADKNSSQKYIQTWTDNMSKMGKAKITKNGRGEEYTRVTFKPDLKRFGMDSIDEDTVALLKKRVHDLAGTVRDIKVFLNDERIKVKGFKQYVDLYLNSVAEQAAESSGGAAQAKPTMIYETISSRWEVAFAVSDGTFQQVSFANSISTIKGGTHVTLIADQIAKNLLASIQKKNKAATVKAAQIKNHMWIFVNALIENPTFDSQTKETLTLPASKFGTKPVVSEDFMKKVQKSSIVDHVLNWARFKADQQMKKTDGSRRTRLSGLPKLSDANNAGTKKATDCTLILTEGDSAKSLAVAGLSVVGRDNFGVFPLRGKLLNVRDAKHEQIMKNEEIQNIKKILGLQHNKDYQDTNGLRYGRLMLMTDQDHDGSHIKGLLINYLDHFYPSLLKVPKFLVEFITPIVRVTKGGQKINFYTMPEYEQWKEETPNQDKWKHKYFKGLGTSTDDDARDYFKQMRKHMIPFSTTQEGDRELIELAFSKKKADERKEWLRQCRPGTFLDHTQQEIPFSDFINKELILFSMADNVRSIPSVVDGLKPGQRKVIWACFKRKLKGEIKVAQLVGYVSEHAQYHHGEQSLMSTIVNLAQDYVGSNNMNILMPNGQFGTRDQGGKDHASARYIYTELAPITRSVFHPNDDPLMAFQAGDDGKFIEPDFYVPVLPMVLVNGAEGIGTGWSTSIPCFNPEDIIANIRRVMNNEEQVPMFPWWRGFNGTIKKTSDNKYDVLGCIQKIDDTTVEITELPIGKWTQNYKAELEAMCGEKGDGPIKDYKEYHNNMNVHFVITMDPKHMEKAEAQGLHEFFKLTSKVNTGNMICFDFDAQIKKYSNPEQIIEEFYPKRLLYYQMRKDYMASELETELSRLTNQARFVQMIVNKELVVNNRKKADIVAELRKLDFRPFPKVSKAKKAGETEELVEINDEGDDDEEEGKDTDFDYLLGMAIWSLTKEKIAKLLAQAKEKEQELLAFLELTPIVLWQKDLDQFLYEWRATCDRWETKIISADSANKKGKRKQTTLKLLTKKARGTDDSEDEFKPAKATAKAKKSESKPVAKKPPQAGPSGSKVKTEDDDPDDAKPPPVRKAAKKAVKDESDSDLEPGESKPAPPKKAAARKAKKEDDDSDWEVVGKRAPTAKKTASPTEDIHSDIEVVPPPSKDKGKGKARVASNPKRKSPDDEASDDDVNARPKKKKADGSLTDFFAKAPAKQSTARKPSSGAQATKGRAVSGKKAGRDEDELSSDDELAAPPAPKTTARKPSSSKPAAKKGAKHVDDDVSMDDDIPPPPKVAPKVSGSKPATAAKKATSRTIDSDDDAISEAQPPARAAAPRRAARGVAKSYIEIMSSEEEEAGQGGSEFEDFD